MDRLGNEKEEPERRERYIPGDWHLQRKEVSAVALSSQLQLVSAVLTFANFTVCLLAQSERRQRKRKTSQRLAQRKRLPN